ncbi:MAG TPA: hypothetical protein VGX23_33400 [Actinocrinis sp.]|nr:hypothetical protein [Actinocrinis sp.]
MPENPPPNEPGWPPQVAPDSPGRALATALGAGAIPTLVWGPVSGLTGRHYLALLPVIGALLAIALTSTPARRARFPLVAFVLGFAVGYLGDIAAVALLLWRHGYAATLILDHLTQVAGAVKDGHSAGDWGFFLVSGAVATVTTARHEARPTTAVHSPR